MRFFYVHFSKAGGTSLKAQLNSSFAGRVVNDHHHNPIGGGGHIRTETSLPADVQGVMGHLHPSRYARWSDAMSTILREPVRNIISIYHYWLSLPPIGNVHHDRFLKEKPGIVDFAKSSPLTTLMSESFFGNFDMGRFQFVGFHEDRRASIDTISRLLGTPLDHGCYLNRTDERYCDARECILEDERMTGALRDVLREDVTFYDRMRACWS